jgi:pRiA4b ORF-3-like protein
LRIRSACSTYQCVTRDEEVGRAEAQQSLSVVSLPELSGEDELGRAPRARFAAYQLKIALTGVEPFIWRRLLVPATLTLDSLHWVFQRTMGWSGAHLHEFLIDGRRYGEPDPEAAVSAGLPERAVALRDVVSRASMFIYVYDFGDDWRHEVMVENILSAKKQLGASVCLAGERHCPPEDCGGVQGYEELLAAIRDAKHPEHRATREWVGRQFDPEAFDVAAVNQALRRGR